MTDFSPVPRAEVLQTRPGGRLDQNPAAVYLSRLAPRSRRTMEGALNTIAAMFEADPWTLPWHELRYQHAQLVRTFVAERYAPATANRLLSALRGVLKECWRLGLIDAETYHRAADVEAVRGSRLPKGRALSQGELSALFRACTEKDGPAGIRDAALLATLYAGGLRRSEAVALDLSHYDPETGSLTVRGKGDKERLVYLQNGARQATSDWLEVRGQEAGPLFFRIRQGGAIIRTRLTDQAVLDILQRRCEQADVRSASPHDLRRSMISDLLDAGADISTVQKLAGHASVSTTQRYDRRGEGTKRKAAGLLHVPYARRGA